MEFNFQDKGNYLRGLLILIGKDNIIDDAEREKTLEIGNRLGFDPKFCNDAVSEFLDNEYISDLPPIFSSTILAKGFLTDAINLSLVDQELHTEELIWLKNVAKKNKIDDNWLDNQLRNYITELPSKKVIVNNNKIIPISN